jgi:hypothetical protein
MAKLYQGINGPFSGKVGTVVGYLYKGMPVMRARPNRTKPFTPRELNQQARFRLMNKFLRPLNDLLNTTFAHLAVRMTGFNKAFSYNVKNAISGVNPDLAIDYGMVLLSRGDLPGAESPAVESPSPAVLEFIWTDNSGKGQALASDKAFVAIYHEESGLWKYQLDIATRNAAKYTWVLTERIGSPVQTYIGFISEDRKDASDSVYAGLVNL